MTEESTVSSTASSPPSFMTEKVEAAQSKAERIAAREEEAQNQDDLDIRAAAIVKATSRLTEQADYLSRIDGVVSTTLPEFIAKNSLGQCVDLFVDLEEAARAVEEQTKNLLSRLATAREVSFPARLDAEDTKTTTSAATGHRMTRNAKIFASIISDTTGETLKRAYDWLRNHNLGSLIKETVNSSSLSAAAKELMENGQELPDDLFKIHTKDNVSITKGKKKATA